MSGAYTRTHSGLKWVTGGYNGVTEAYSSTQGMCKKADKGVQRV